MARNLKLTENEKYTLSDVKYGEEKKKVENLKMSTVGHGIWQENRKPKNMRNFPLTT